MSDLATITRADARGMITLRGDLSSAAIKKAVKAATGHAIPKPGKLTGTAEAGALWMSPDELLVMVPYAKVAEAVADLGKALAGQHHLVADVSDARAVFTVSGPHPREVLGRLCPVDLHPDSFAVGDVRRTRMAQVAAAFWAHETGFDVVCFRSVGDYMDGLLRNAAKASPTGVFGAH